jgi:manganese transport protein
MLDDDARLYFTVLLTMLFTILGTGISGNSGAGKLLVLSQVILSLALSFAVIPLVHFTSSKSKLGSFANCWASTIIGWILALIIAGLNAYLVVSSIISNQFGGTSGGA